MIVSARAKKIIQYLLQVDRFVKIGDIARKLGTTERTIYRSMYEVNEILTCQEIDLLNKEGLGIRLKGSNKQMEKLRMLLAEDNQRDVMNSEERSALIILWLLHYEDYVKMQELALNLKVSLPTVRTDMKQVKRMLNENNLEVCIKKGHGIKIEGNELSIRKYISKLILYYVELEVLYKWISKDKTSHNEFLELLEHFNYQYYTSQTYGLIKNLIRENVNDASIIEFILLLSMLVMRHSKINENGYFISDEIMIDECTSHTVRNIVEQLEIIFDITLSKVECEYLRWLVGLNLYIRNQKYLVGPQESGLFGKVKEFVIMVESSLGVKIHNDEVLLSGLISHLDRAFARVQNNMFLSNPMKKEIKQDYVEVYKTIKTCFNTVFEDARFPEDEIAYLVLYFVVAIDKLMAKSTNVLVICTSGMGSSKLLANRLEREIAEVKIKKIISLIALHHEDLNDYDLIVSTVPLDIDSEKSMVVSPLLTIQEVDAIKQKIGMKRGKIIHRNAKVSYQKQNKSAINIIELNKMRKICDWGIALVENFKVIPLTIKRDMNVVNEIEKYLINNEHIAFEDDQKRFGIANNQQLFEIPNTKLIYFEFCVPSIKSPIFMEFTLDKEDESILIHNQPSKAETFILILYPEEGLLIQEFLSALAITIIDSTYTIETFETGSEEKIRDLLSTKIKQYLSELF